MRAPKVYLFSVLITSLTLLAAGQDQTSTAPTVVQVVNAKYADPKPCSNGWHTALDTVGNPVNSPGPEATGKRPLLPPSGIGRGIPAVPVNPPTVIFPPSKPEPMSLRYVYFETFFNEIGLYNQWAEQADKAGKHTEAEQWRTSQRTAGLNDAEGEVLQEIAHGCNCAVNELDAKMNALAEKFRAQIVPGATVTVPSDFYQMFEDRKTIVIDHVEQLRAALGDTSFKKLETYALSMFPAPESVAKPVPPSTAGKNRTENK
ncbi:MAG: hypothetical protein LAO78_22115 [Acidobacteriia bacterium]|nr:hypothetical protein [Terriglobia bacterium]